RQAAAPVRIQRSLPSLRESDGSARSARRCGRATAACPVDGLCWPRGSVLALVSFVLRLRQDKEAMLRVLDAPALAFVLVAGVVLGGGTAACSTGDDTAKGSATPPSLVGVYQASDPASDIQQIEFKESNGYAVVRSSHATEQGAYAL